MHTNASIWTHKYSHAHTYTTRHTHAFIHTHIFTCTHTHMDAQIYTCTERYTQCTHTQVHTCIHMHTQIFTGTHTHSTHTHADKCIYEHRHTHPGTHIHMDAGSTYITWLIPTHSLILSSFFSGNPARSQTSQLNNCKEPHSFPSLCLFAFTPSGIPEHQRLLSHGGQEPTSAHNRDCSGWNPSSTAYCLGNLG